MLRDAGDLLAPAVERALTQLGGGITAADAGAAQLARRYAAVIDQAARAAELAEHALGAIDADDVNARAWIGALAAKVEEKELLERLGPKLLAALESLGATPAARAKAKGGKPDSAPASKLAALRDTRRAQA